jgi:hypothetical protein
MTIHLYIMYQKRYSCLLWPGIPNYYLPITLLIDIVAIFNRGNLIKVETGLA